MTHGRDRREVLGSGHIATDSGELMIVGGVDDAFGADNGPLQNIKVIQ